MTAKRKDTLTPERAGAEKGVMALTKVLWEAAVGLRGAVEPADYKRYVLPIIFLRFLSHRYERRWAELAAMIADPQNKELYGDKKALDDPSAYRSARAFLVPHEARWDTIVKSVQREDIRAHLDEVLERLETRYPEQLRGLFPRIYADSNLEAESLRGLIHLFSHDVFRQEPEAEDLLGRTYEYFIGEFASSEGRRGGEYFTPPGIVKTLVAMLEPTRGVVFDPCCGSGGMFVQSSVFADRWADLTFYGQESKDFTFRLCRMNLFIHGLDGDVQLGNSYANDKHAGLQADYILANPPFNDGSRSKGENGWGTDKVAAHDPRLVVGTERMPLAPRNANSMWILHFLHHLKEGGTAGFVMATSELTSHEAARFEVRKALIEQDYVDCIVQLSGQMFANTQVPCSLWFLSKNRQGSDGLRRRAGELLFIDARELGSRVPGSRKQRQFLDGDSQRIASVYRNFRRSHPPAPEPGFCRVVSIDEVRACNYRLAVGRYVGSPESEVVAKPFAEQMIPIMAEIRGHLDESKKVDRQLQLILERVLS